MPTKLFPVALVALPLIFVAVLAAAQTSESPSIEPPMGDLPSLDLSPEGLAKMAPGGGDATTGGTINLGAGLGLDEGELRAETMEERAELMLRRAEEMKQKMLGQVAERLGVTVDELVSMSEQDVRALEDQHRSAIAVERAAEDQHRSATVVVDEQPAFPLPLPLPAPPGGFRDGSEGLVVDAGYVAELAVAEPEGKEMLMVIADPLRREIVWRAERTPPFVEPLRLDELAADPSRLVIELIDPGTRRVVRRFRPVAGAG